MYHIILKRTFREVPHPSRTIFNHKRLELNFSLCLIANSLEHGHGSLYPHADHCKGRWLFNILSLIQHLLKVAGPVDEKQWMSRNSPRKAILSNFQDHVVQSFLKEKISGHLSWLLWGRGGLVNKLIYLSVSKIWKQNLFK